MLVFILSVNNLCSFQVFYVARSKSGLLQLHLQRESYNHVFAVCILAHWQESSLQDALPCKKSFLLPQTIFFSICVQQKVVFHDLHHYMFIDPFVRAYVNAISDPHTHTHTHTLTLMKHTMHHTLHTQIYMMYAIAQHA